MRSTAPLRQQNQICENHIRQAASVQSQAANHQGHFQRMSSAQNQSIYMYLFVIPDLDHMTSLTFEAL